MNLQNASAVLSAVTFETSAGTKADKRSSFVGQRETLNRSSSAGGSGPISGGASTLIQKLADSPYSESLKSKKALAVADRTNLIHTDFFNGIQRRKALIVRLRDTALEPSNSQAILKRFLLEIRQLTLRLIEDSLEMEYRAQVVDTNISGSSKSVVSVKNYKQSQQKDISTFMDIEIKSQIYALKEMVTDVDHLFKIDNIRSMLPKDFPHYRNPFMLGKSVDQLADILPPHAEPGDREVELKILELLRFKRAAKVLLRAEIEVMNRLPVVLSGIDALIARMADDKNIERLLRCVCTFLDNIESSIYIDRAPNFGSLTSIPFHVEAHLLLRNVNKYRGEQPMRMDIQAAVRLMMNKVNLDAFEGDATVTFFMEWINSVLRHSLSKSMKPSVEPISMPDTGEPAKFQEYGTKIKPLSVRNVTDHKYGDLTSEVVTPRKMDTHESFYVESTPKKKVLDRAASPSNIIKASSADQFEKRKSISFAADKNDRAYSSSSSMKHSNKGVASSSAQQQLLEHQQLQMEQLQQQMQLQQMQMQQFMMSGGPSTADPTAAPVTAPLPAIAAVDVTELKQQISKVISEMGLLSKINKIANAKPQKSALMAEVEKEEKGSNEDEDTIRPPGPLEIASSLTTLRYQLFKMQQELLRRQVLDGRHYKANGFDAIQQTKKGLIVIDTDPTNGNFYSPMSNLPNQKSTTIGMSSPDDKTDIIAPYGIDEIHLLDSEIPPINGTTRSIECNYDTATEKLICRVKKMVAEPVAPKSEDDEDEDDGAYRVVKKKKVKLIPVCTAFVVVSKLVFNLLTEHTIEGLLNNSNDGQKAMLRSIVEQIQKKASETPEPKGQIELQIERLLHQCHHIDGGVEVDIVVTRTNECDGIEVLCTPLAGVSVEQISAGPVTIVVSDRELQVLLINQYGMLSQSRSKWRAMVMVAQWITARVRVQRVLTTQPALTTFDGTSTFSDLFAQTAGATTDAPKLMDTMEMSSTLPADTTMRSSANQNPLTTILPKTASQNKRNLVLFDVQLDRKIELSTDLRARWKSRSLPNIVGIVVDLKAWQDLDMLILSVDIRLPTQNQYMALKDRREKSKKKEAPRKTAGEANARRQKRLAALAGNTEEDDDGEDESESDDDEELEKIKGTTEMNFEYTLTYAELSVFGTSELIMQKKVGLQNNKGDQGHPEAFIWNILSRYQISFSGSLKNPFADECSIVDSTNWQSTFDRRVLREVKTISSCVLVVSVSIVGPELLFESETVDKNAKKRIIPKTMTENELRDVVHSEGLSPLLLEYPRRKELAQAMLSKLKLVEDNSSAEDNSSETGLQSDVPTFRLELLSFYETKMLKIAVQKKLNQPILDIGSVEINYQLTLSDLRILIRFEIDAEEIPNQFRFVYKGSPCSIKQEQFRRAWDCIPRCIIAPKMVEKIESGIETEDIEEKRNKTALNKIAGKHARLVRGQRRVSGKFSAIPLSTLCQVTENGDEIYLLHDGRDLLVAGDIIRIGNVLSRDYIVAAMSKLEMNNYPKTIKIEPSYDLLEEPDFNIPSTGNFIYPKGVAGVITINFKKHNVLPPPATFGFNYEIPKPVDPSSSSSSSVPGNKGAANMSDNLKSLLNKSKKSMPANQTYMNCWIWKCIPAAEDTRPKWRQLYDDGLIPYDYEFKSSNECFKYFRVKAMYSYLEVLCTDARCASMSLYKQRVDDMQSFSIEYYLKLIFDKVTGWNPEYKRGMEKLKYMKLLKDINAFTDLKRPSRVTQLENLFAKEVKENGISNKFATYDGFVRLLQDIAIIRFPPPKKPGEEDQDDQSISSMPESVASTNISTSAATNPTKLGRIGRKDSAVESTASEVKPMIDPQYAASALEKFVLEVVMMYPDWYSIPWKEAKLSTMRKEALPYCAVTRIAATFRGWKQRRRYLFCIRNLIVFQASVRRLFSRRRTQAYLKILTDDWIFRQRYYAATRAQSLVRQFLKRCWFWRIMEKIRAQEVIVQKARRFRIKKIRRAQKKFILYKEAIRVNGVICYIKMLKLDTRNYSRDNGVMLEVYTPYDQKKYQFPIEEPDLRKYMQMALEVDALTVGDLIDVRNLKKVVAQRIIAYKATSRFASQNVVFSKHALGQRGEQKITRGKIINGELFVCKIFETGDDFSIQCYHNYTSKVFVAMVTKLELRAWIADEFLIGAKPVDQSSDQYQLSMQKVPVILLPENIRFLHQWLLDNLAVDTRQGKFRLLFRRQLQKSRKLERIIKIQSHFRRALTRKIIIEKLDALMLKVRVSPIDSTVYYLNKKTGASSWDKPKVLGPWDIPTEPVRKWIEVTYLHDGMWYRHYVNPHTGKYTNFTPDQAAKKIQSLSRNFLLRPIRMPFDQFVKAGTIYKTAKQVYDKEKDQRKLAAVINYAITSHVVDLDEPLGKRLYGEAVDLSEANPLVTRAFAFYMVGTCEAPIALNRERANTLLNDAKKKDDAHSKFQIAYYIYRFACLRNPYDHRTLLNLALVQCLLYNQNFSAEKLLRRALAMSPFDERVMEIWKFLQDRFPERQLLYNPASRVNLVKMDKSGKKRVIHGRPASQHNSWAGWVFIDDDEFGVSKKYRRHASYWYNPADGTEQQDLPDFKKQWAIRKQRSHYQEQADGILQYFDPLTSEYFQYHELTDSYA